MGKNRNRNKKNLLMGAVPKLLVLAVALVCGAVVFWSFDSKCYQLGQEIHKQEQELVAKQNEYIHEEMRWKENLIASNLDRAILRHGLGMGIPTPRQIVYIDAEGQPLKTQPSYAHVKPMMDPNKAFVAQ